jgi:hypothetical protein
VEVDTGDLSEEDATQLLRLIDALDAGADAGAGGAPVAATPAAAAPAGEVTSSPGPPGPRTSRPPVPGPGADRFQYDVTLHRSEGERTLRTHDGAEAAVLRELVSRVWVHARHDPGAPRDAGPSSP